MTELSSLKLAGARLLLALSLLLCALSPAIAQSSRYADSSDDGSRRPCPLVVGTIDDAPSARPVEEARCVAAFFGQFTRSGYSLKQVGGDAVATISVSRTARQLATVDPLEGLRGPTPERPPQA